MKILIRIIIIFSLFVFVGMAIFIVYLMATYIDNEVKSGEAYGLKIGDSQYETYRRAQNYLNDHLKEHPVFILFPLDKEGYGPHKEFNFTEEEYVLLREREKWEFFFDKGFFDFLELRFENGILVTVYRHRKKFELP